MALIAAWISSSHSLLVFKAAAAGAEIRQKIITRKLIRLINPFITQFRLQKIISISILSD
jgi:hypothetical protein